MFLEEHIIEQLIALQTEKLYVSHMKSCLGNSSSHQKTAGIHPFGKNTFLCLSVFSNSKFIFCFFCHLIIFNLVICNLHAQQSPWANLAFGGPTEEWVARIQGPANDLYGPFLQVDKSGNSYIAGTHQINDSVYLLCAKYNTSGVQQWEKMYIYPGEAYIRPSGLALDSNGNAIVIAVQGPASYLPTHGLIAKFNTVNGNLEWVRRYFGDYGWGVFLDIKLDKLNNIYVAGRSDTSHLVIRYNTNGDSVWVRKYHPPAPSPYIVYEIASACTIDDSLNIIFTGRRIFSNPPFGSVDSVLTAKYSSGGVLRWESTYFYSITANAGEKITSDQNGNIYVGGATVISGSGVYLTLKYDRNGVQQWAKIYDAPGSGDNILTGIAMDRINNALLVTGRAVTNGIQMATTIKYNTATGDSIWVRKDTGTYDGAASRNISLDSSGNIFIIGETYNFPSYVPYDILTVKYSPTGTQLWRITYNGNFNGLDIGKVIGLDAYRNVYVLGTSQSGTQITDYVVIKYNQLSGIEPISNENPNEYRLLQNYPNPFNSSTVINYEIPLYSDVAITVYDVLGREVKELIKSKQKAGIYRVTMDDLGLSSGVYIYRLIANNKIVGVKKLIIIK